MPKWVPNLNFAVTKLVKEKQQNEVDFGKKMLEAFAKPALLDPIKTLVLLATFEMCNQDDQVKAALKLAIEEETRANNAFVKNAEFLKASDGKPSALTGEIMGKFNPTDCSNAIRLYGAFIEKFSAVLKVKKDALRVDFTNRDRFRDGAQATAVKKEVDRLKTSSPQMLNMIEKFEAGGMGEYWSVQKALVGVDGGQAQWRLDFASRMLKLDTWFGLVGASEISGTTTDTLWFLNNSHSTASLSDPIYNMLPLGTIVSGAHHSVLEVAIPLSQNKLNDYSIGKYSSLMVNGSTHPAKGDIQTVCTAAENDKRNHLMVLAYTMDPAAAKEMVNMEKAKRDAAKEDKKGPNTKLDAYLKTVQSIKLDGGYMFDPSEKAAFFAMANAMKLNNKDVVDKVMHAFPARSEVKAFLQKNGFPAAE